MSGDPGVATYRPRETVQAVQLTEGADWDAIAEWCGGRRWLHEAADGERKDFISVPGSEFTVDATEGSWIVRRRGFEVWERTAFGVYYEEVS